MLLVIDNYDSFVYNLARYVRLATTEEVRVIRDNEISLKAIKDIKPSAIIISPGPGSPSDYALALDVVQHLHQEIPILGACLGHQVIGVSFGYIIDHALRPLHGKSSLIWHNQEGLFKGLANPLRVGRYHSLIVKENINSDNSLIISAMSAQGEIMALKHRQYPLYGVQFHPESILTEGGMQMIEQFVATI